MPVRAPGSSLERLSLISLPRDCLIDLLDRIRYSPKINKSRSISSISAGRFGLVKLMFGAGIRLCLMPGGTCLWWGWVLASDGSVGWGQELMAR